MILVSCLDTKFCLQIRNTTRFDVDENWLQCLASRGVENKNISKFRFVSTQKCFILILFRINFLHEEFHFVLKSKQFGFAMRSKSNREKLGSFRAANMLYRRAALNIPCDHSSSSHEFSTEDDDTDK